MPNAYYTEKLLGLQEVSIKKVNDTKENYEIFIEQPRKQCVCPACGKLTDKVHDYLSIADKVYMMEDYLIRDVTERSKDICRSCNVTAALPAPADWQQSRTLYSDRFTSYPEGSGTEKLEVSDMGFIIIGDERIDVRGFHDIVSPRQLDTLGFMLRYLELTNADRRIDIDKKINDMYKRIDEEGIDFLYSTFFTTCKRFLDLTRKQELTALINRMRRINMVKSDLGS